MFKLKTFQVSQITALLKKKKVFPVLKMCINFNIIKLNKQASKLLHLEVNPLDLLHTIEFIKKLLSYVS